MLRLHIKNPHCINDYVSLCEVTAHCLLLDLFNKDPGKSLEMSNTKTILYQNGLIIVIFCAAQAAVREN